MKNTLPLLPIVLSGCFGPDTPPTIEIRDPVIGEEIASFDGHARIDVRVAVSDERNHDLTVEYIVDDEVLAEVVTEGCRKGCQVTGPIPTSTLAEGRHMLRARVTDPDGNVVEIPVEEAIPFDLFDVPYIERITVQNTSEGVFNGPDREVEVHLVDDETATYKGCAALTEVQEDALPYDELGVPFVSSALGENVRFETVAFEPVRLVVIESDGGDHCPIQADLTDTFESDGDELYGISVPLDLSVLFNEPFIEVSNGDFQELRIMKGRPINRDVL